MLRGDARPFLLARRLGGRRRHRRLATPIAGRVAHRPPLGRPPRRPTRRGGGGRVVRVAGLRARRADRARCRRSRRGRTRCRTADVAFYDHVLRMDPDGDVVVRGARTTTRAASARALRELSARAARPWRAGRDDARAPGPRRAPLGGRGRRAPDRRGRALPGQPHPAARGTARRRPARRVRRRRPRPTRRPTRAFFGGDGHARPVLLARAVPAPRRATRVDSDPIKGTRARDAARRCARARAQGRGRARDDRRPRAQRPRAGRALRHGDAPTAPRDRARTPACATWSRACEARTRRRDDADLVRAAFPPGSVTGAPKVQAMKTIAALEATGREVYTGAIGYLSPVAGLELNVAIRTLEVTDGHAWLGVGGGIVARLRSGARAAGGARQGAAGARGARRRATPDPPPGAAARSRRCSTIPRPDPALGLLETMLAVDGEIPLPGRATWPGSATTPHRADALDARRRATRRRRARHRVRLRRRRACEVGAGGAAAPAPRACGPCLDPRRPRRPQVGRPPRRPRDAPDRRRRRRRAGGAPGRTS